VKKVQFLLPLLLISYLSLTQAQTNSDEQSDSLEISVESMRFVAYDNRISLDSLVLQGQYDYISPDLLELSEKNKDSSRGVFKFCLVHCNFNVMSEQIFEFLASRGLRAATERELLSWGYPQDYALIDHRHVVALGDTLLFKNGVALVTVISRDFGYRNLTLDFYDKYWSSNYKFAAIEK